MDDCRKKSPYGQCSHFNPPPPPPENGGKPGFCIFGCCKIIKTTRNELNVIPVYTY